MNVRQIVDRSSCISPKTTAGATSGASGLPEILNGNRENSSNDGWKNTIVPKCSDQPAAAKTTKNRRRLTPGRKSTINSYRSRHSKKCHRNETIAVATVAADRAHMIADLVPAEKPTGVRKEQQRVDR